MGEQRPCTCCGRMTYDTTYLSNRVQTGSNSYTAGNTVTTTTYYNDYSATVPLCFDCKQHINERSKAARVFKILGNISILMIIASFFTRIPYVKFFADIVTGWTLFFFDLSKLDNFAFFLRLAAVAWIPFILYFTSAFLNARFEVKWIRNHPGHESIHGGIFISNKGKFEDWKSFLIKRGKKRNVAFIVACFVVVAWLAVPFVHRVKAIFFEEDPAVLSVMLSNAASRSNMLSVNLLLKRGADPNAALESAVDTMDTRLLSLLFAEGADPNYRFMDAYPADVKPETVPTLFALDIRRMTPEMVKLFLDAGADPNVPAQGPDISAENQRSILCEVVDFVGMYSDPDYRKEQQFEIASLLLDAGADPGTKGGPAYAKPALRIAAQNNWPEMIALLVKAGAEMKRADAIAMMDDCIKNDRPEALQALLEAGGPANARNSQGYTLIQEAMRVYSEPMGRMLLEHGANPLLKDEYGLDAYDTVRNDPELKDLLNQYRK